MMNPTNPSGTFSIGGELPIRRLGYGAMQITGKGVWGEPADPDEAIRVLKRCPEIGINFIDTADSYGPEVSERLIAEALHPYADGLIIATKGGFERPGPGKWVENGKPAHLRAACEGSLKRLKLNQIPLYQLHRIDRKVPLPDQIGTLLDLRKEGKIHHIGLSEVSVEQIKDVQKLTPIATVQNRYNLVDRGSEDMLAYCTANNIGFIPWFPLATGSLAQPGGPLAKIAERLNAPAAIVALAWLLQKSKVMLPIPGTSKVSHLEENTRGADLKLDAKTFAELDAM